VLEVSLSGKQTSQSISRISNVIQQNRRQIDIDTSS